MEVGAAFARRPFEIAFALAYRSSRDTPQPAGVRDRGREACRLPSLPLSPSEGVRALGAIAGAGVLAPGPARPPGPDGRLAAASGRAAAAGVAAAAARDPVRAGRRSTSAAR